MNNDMHYFLMSKMYADFPYRMIDTPAGGLKVADGSVLDQPLWNKGKAFSDDDHIRITIELNLKRAGSGGAPDEELAEWIVHAQVPLFRDDFIASLKDCGVNDMQCYDVSLKDPDNGKIYTNYKAVNIVGVLPREALGPQNASEDKLAMFRIDKAIGIFVHKSLKECLTAKGFTRLSFVDPVQAAL